MEPPTVLTHSALTKPDKGITTEKESLEETTPTTSPHSISRNNTTTTNTTTPEITEGDEPKSQHSETGIDTEERETSTVTTPSHATESSAPDTVTPESVETTDIQAQIDTDSTPLAASPSQDFETTRESAMEKPASEAATRTTEKEKTRYTTSAAGAPQLKHPYQPPYPYYRPPFGPMPGYGYPQQPYPYHGQPTQ
uniref:Uncharacterized protein n=1 Tax=Candidatus Kentrum eta TaxID=2126337 RepID=A0A450UUC8_9GAMM|nr:MAG: hypothetical protein BECKH772A_GA0070896_100852 [Candidatus Kentron sp. H]VFJ96159.1 MAG: hypothetical protein BECKH772B_GA0070898_100882 [Candidatus Kentron sp. H]VFK02188.1 MAG: hypothetical protein BECKH772C_GA0070978_100842 [Candidatus Kentron sp. H]